MTEREKQLAEIVERIMTMHWDMAACRCWVCEAGRLAGCGAREEHLTWRAQFGYVPEPRKLSTEGK